jgi:hypothetical protein
MAITTLPRPALRALIAALAPSLFLALTAPNRATAQSTCVTNEGDSGTVGAFYTGLGQIQTVVSIQADPDSAPIDSEQTPTGTQLKNGLDDAAAAWSQTCAGSNTPDFSMNVGATRDAPFSAGWATSVGVDYRLNEEVQDIGGRMVLATFNDSTGVLTVYGRCRNTQGELFGAICNQVGSNLYIDWSDPWAVQYLRHELGHALGIGHDDSSGDCGGFNGIMEVPVPYREGQIKMEHCEYADFKNCDPAMGVCPDDPRLPDDPIADLPDLCDRVPELCSPDGPGGGPSPWWNVPETQPTCGVVSSCDNFGWCDTSRTCYFDKGALLPRTVETSQGPTTAVLSPADSALVSGTVQIDGWSRDEDLGVTGTLGFWVDRQSVYPAGVTYGDADSAACSGSTDPNCPYVGFSASLDTTQLADGYHTLEVVTAEAAVEQPTPGYVPTRFLVDNTKPAASITAPAAGATLSGTVQVTGTASDVNGISTVSFYVDGVYQTSDNTAPYTFSLNTLSWPNGSHTLKTRTWDGAGNGKTSTVTVTFANDTQVPQVSLSQPSAGALVRGNVTVKALASDDQGVSHVEFRLDGALLATDATAPYQVSWSTTATSDGSHSLTARAFDGTGNVGVSAARSVTVDNTLPKMFVDFPSHQQAVAGTSVRIAGWAIDASGVVSRTFKLNGQPLPLNGAVQTVSRSDVCATFPEIADPACPSVGWRAFFDSTAYPNGGYTLSVTATDAAGNAKTFNRSMSIANPPVTLSFNPVADATAWQAYPTYNDGTSSTLAARTTSGGEGAYAFLKFQVSGVAGPVTSATLRVKTLNAMTDLWLYWLVHSNWTESNLTWSYFPGPGGDLDHTYNVYGGYWYSFDVTSFVNGNGTYSMGFANSNSSYAYLWSRQSSYPPVLEVTYQP